MDEQKQTYNYKIMDLIKLNLTPDLLKKQYRELNKDNPTYGHCYVATEVLYHMMMECDTNFPYKPHYGKDKNNITHWWLENGWGDRLDVTKEQYTMVNEFPPYSVGKRASFLTNHPSKRAVKLMDKVGVFL